MALLPTGWIKMPGDNDETKRFAWSHVKSIFYNKAANILLKDKLDEMDKIIDEKIAKALMSNVQVNDQGKIPTSALAYAMQQSITKNGQDIAKLNSDFKARDASLEIGQVERGAYIYLRNKVTNNLLMLRLNEDDKKLVFNSEVDGQWGTETELVTKSDLFSNVALVTDVHNIGKSCLFRAEYGSANTPTSDLGYIGISVCVGSNWKFVICSPYSGGKLFFDSVNTSGSWIGWKEIAFK